MKHKKHAFYAMKYLPVATGIVTVADSALAIMGKHYELTEALANTGLMSAILIFATSRAYGFCWLHKLFTIYVFQSSVATCFFFQHMSPISVYYHKHLFFLEGAILVVLLLFKIKMFHKDAPK